MKTETLRTILAMTTATCLVVGCGRKEGEAPEREQPETTKPAAPESQVETPVIPPVVPVVDAKGWDDLPPVKGKPIRRRRRRLWRTGRPDHLHRQVGARWDEQPTTWVYSGHILYSSDHMTPGTDRLTWPS